MVAPIKTGLLSFGMSGKVFHAPFLEAHPGFELTAVVERSIQRATGLYPNIRSFASVDELLADDSLELVVVNTPNHLHVEHVRKALEAGRHVLVEKPFAPTPDEAEALFDLAEKKGLHLLPYQNRRYDTDFHSVREVVESGVLGTLTEVHIRFDRFRPEIGPKYFKEEPLPASGLSFDLGPHLLDQTIALFGAPLRWHKTVGYHRLHTKVDDCFHFQLEYPEGLNVFVSANMLAVEAPPAYFLMGSKGTFVKNRTDVQEVQLVGGMKPTDAEYGLEAAGSEGKLSLMDKEGLHTTWIPAKTSTYRNFFDAVWMTLRRDEPFPIDREAIRMQLEMLS